MGGVKVAEDVPLVIVVVRYECHVFWRIRLTLQRRGGSVVSGQWSVVSGQWSVVSGQWSVVSGQWSVVSGQWSVVSGQWSVVSG